MEMLQLQYFYDSAKTESFAKTAEKYLVPTSSVSGSVRRLEKELGCQLFDRTCNRIHLNRNGKRLLHSVSIAFEELGGAMRELSQNAEDTREIKMLVRAMRSNITDCIIEHSKLRPHIPFKTNFDFAEHEFDAYDIIIDEKSDAYPKHERFELCRLDIGMTVSKTDALCGKTLTLKQLADRPFISLGEQSNMHRILMRACKTAGFTPNIAVLSNDVKCFEKLVRSGIGIGLERRRSHPDGVTYLNITDFDEPYIVYAYYKKDAAYGNVQHFLDFLKSKTFEE